MECYSILKGKEITQQHLIWVWFLPGTKLGPQNRKFLSTDPHCSLARTDTSSQYGGIGRHALPPCTITKRITTKSQNS